MVSDSGHLQDLRLFYVQSSTEVDMGIAFSSYETACPKNVSLRDYLESGNVGAIFLGGYFLGVF